MGNFFSHLQFINKQREKAEIDLTSEPAILIFHVDVFRKGLLIFWCLYFTFVNKILN